MTTALTLSALLLLAILWLAYREWRAHRARVQIEELKHGTRAGYELHKCKCDECRLVHNARMRASRKRRIEKGKGGA